MTKKLLTGIGTFLVCLTAAYVLMVIMFLNDSTEEQPPLWSQLSGPLPLIVSAVAIYYWVKYLNKDVQLLITDLAWRAATLVATIVTGVVAVFYVVMFILSLWTPAGSTAEIGMLGLILLIGAIVGVPIALLGQRLFSDKPLPVL